MNKFWNIIWTTWFALASLISSETAVGDRVVEVLSPCKDLTQVLKAYQDKEHHDCINAGVLSRKPQPMIEDKEMRSVAWDIWKPDSLGEFSFRGLESILADIWK